MVGTGMHRLGTSKGQTNTPTRYNKEWSEVQPFPPLRHCEGGRQNHPGQLFTCLTDNLPSSRSGQAHRSPHIACWWGNMHRARSSLNSTRCSLTYTPASTRQNTGYTTCTDASEQRDDSLPWMYVQLTTVRAADTIVICVLFTILRAKCYI